MALTPTTFSTGYKSTTSFGTGVYTTPSFTSSDSQLLVVFLTYWKAFGSGSADPLQATISDSAGLTWKFLGRVWLTADAPLGICIYTAEVTTGASMTISVDNGAVNVSSYHVHVLGFTDYRTFNPIDMIVGSGTTSTGDGAETQTLRDAPASADYTYIHLAVDCNGTVANPTWSGFTQDYQTNSGSDFGVACTSHRTGSTSTTCAVTDVYTGGSTYFKSAMVSLIVRDKDTPIAPIFVGAGAGLTTITDGGNITPALPVDPISSTSMPWLEDDVGFVLVSTNANNLPTIAGGGAWTEETGFTQSNAAQSAILWWRRLVGGDTAQAVTDGGTTALSSSNQMSGRLYVYRNCIDTGTPFEDQTSTGNTGTETTPDTATIDTTGDNRRAVCFIAIDDDSAYSSGNPPATWTIEVADYTNTTGADLRLAVMGKYIASASTVTTVVIGTLSTAESYRAVTMGLIPMVVSAAAAASLIYDPAPQRVLRSL